MNTTVMQDNHIKIYFQEHENLVNEVAEIIRCLGTQVEDQREGEDEKVYRIKGKYQGCLMIDEPSDNAITIEFPTPEQAQLFYTDYNFLRNNKGIAEAVVEGQ